MMVVIPVMVAELHLLSTLSGNIGACQPVSSIRLGTEIYRATSDGAADVGSCKRLKTLRYRRFRISNRSEARDT